MDAGNALKASTRKPYHNMLGMRLDYIDARTFINEFSSAAEKSEQIYCCVPDVYQCVTCYDRPEHRAIVNEADYVISDSTVLQTARSFRYGVRRTETLLGYELTLALCDEAQRRRTPIALIGGRDGEVLARIKNSLTARFPDLEIAFAFSPPFRALRQDEEDEMLRGLRNSEAKLIFVGLGCPKQEQWMGRYRGEVPAAMIGVGAAFDTIGGIVRASPQVVHRLGLEWLFRLTREPRRLYRRYLGSAPRFVWLLTTDTARSLMSRILLPFRSS